MTEQEIRLHIVEILTPHYTLDIGALVDAGRMVADFVLGAGDAEVLRAARDLADKVKG